MWIRGSGICRDWNGIRYKLGMSGKNVGAKQLSMNVAIDSARRRRRRAHPRRTSR